MIQIAGTLREIGGLGPMTAVIVQPGTKREITITGLTIQECRELGQHLYDGVVLSLVKVADAR